MPFFESIEGSVLLLSNGTFTEAKIFTFEDHVFAKRGAGYIRLLKDGYTSANKVFWQSIEIDESFSFKMGRMVIRSELNISSTKHHKAA